MKTRILFLLLISTCLYGQYNGSTLYWSSLAATGVTSSYQVNGNDKHTIAATTTGSPSGCAVQLEGSLDGTNWFSLSGSQDCSSNLMVHITDRPVQFVRANVTTLSGGTSPKVSVAYLSIRSGGK